MLCKVWGITLNVADAWFEPKSNAAEKRKKGHKFLKRPATRAKVWKRNLCEDGDIESHPGPVSNIEVWTLNVQGPRGAWALIEYVQAIKDLPLTIGLQETRFSSREFAARPFGRASGCLEWKKNCLLIGVVTKGLWLG